MSSKNKQLDKFKEAAKEAETQTDESDFDNALKRIAKPDVPRESQQKSNKNK